MAAALFIAFGLGLFAIALYAFAYGPPKSQWVRVAIMTALGVVGALGTWRAAVDADRVEPVWLDIGTGIKPLAAPIRVLLAPDLDTYTPVVRAAMRMWNDQAGCKVFVEADAAYDARFVFIKDDPCPGTTVADKETLARVHFCDDGTADIDVERLDEIQLAYEIVAHELGHVLGLAHDPVGLMAPGARPLTLVYPSEKDTLAVRARYCTGGP